MLRLMVTASGTGPIAASSATYMATSASAIIVGPEIVPPGRSDPSRNACRTRQPPSHSASIDKTALGMKGLRKLGAEKTLELGYRHHDRHLPPLPMRRQN